MLRLEVRLWNERYEQRRGLQARVRPAAALRGMRVWKTGLQDADEGPAEPENEQVQSA
jgi:hypothetical protein